MQLGQTSRGVNIVKFRDMNDERCSLQESSEMGEPSIWLGVDRPNAQYLKDGKWQNFPIPSDVFLTGRMHLTQEQVKELLIYLERFLYVGRIGEI